MTSEDPFIIGSNTPYHAGNMENRSTLFNFSSRRFYYDSMAPHVASHYSNIGFISFRSCTAPSWLEIIQGAPVLYVPCIATEIFPYDKRILGGHELSKKVWPWKVTVSRSNGHWTKTRKKIRNIFSVICYMRDLSLCLCLYITLI